MSEESANANESMPVAEATGDNEQVHTEPAGDNAPLLSEEKPKETLLDGDGPESIDEVPEVKQEQPKIDYEGISLPYEDATDIVTAAQEHRISKEGLERIVTMVAEREKSSAEAAIAEAKAEEARISQEKRSAFMADVQAKEKLSAANWFLKQAPPETVALIASNPVVANDPGLINLLAKAGNALREGRFREGESANKQPGRPVDRIYTSMTK